MEQGARPTSTMLVKMVSRTAKNWAGALRVSMPYMRQVRKEEKKTDDVLRLLVAARTFRCLSCFARWAL